MQVTYIMFLVFLVYLIVKGKKALHMLQQNLYNENNRYLKWISNNIATAFLNLDIVSCLFIIIGCLLKNDILIILSIAIYVVDMIRIKKIRAEEQVKKPLVITARVKRLLVTISILYLIPLVVTLLNNNLNYSMLMVSYIMVYLEYLVVLLAKVINKPVERCVYLKYYHQAQKKLK